MDEKENGFKTKIKTFFTYYKWYMLIALFFVVTVTVMTVQMCSREEYDISVMYAGNTILSDNAGAHIESAFETLGENDEKAVLYELIVMNDEEIGKAYEKGYTSASVSPEKVRKHRDALALNVMSDEYFLLMLSPECYEIMKSNNALERLDDIGIAVDADALREDEYSLKLKALDFVKANKSFAVLPDDTLLCFKKISEMNADKKQKQAKRMHDIEFLKKLTSYTLNTGSAVAPVALWNGKEWYTE